MYILITEVRPAWIDFKSNLTPFLQANWILTKATFDVVTDEFNSDTETDLNLDAKFRTIEETDGDVSTETNFFISAYGRLNSVWNDFSKVLGKIPSFTSSEESVTLETNDITISNISNSNVELASQNGVKAKFKSLSGKEENFSFDITVNKEGFTRNKLINAKVLAVVDSTAIYQSAVIGSWTVTTLESGSINKLKLLEGGNGRYIIPGPDGANRDGVDENGNSYYNVTWSIEKRNGKYHLREDGFYHFGFESYRTFDITLPENFLTYPVTTFLTYTDFGSGARDAGRRYSKKLTFANNV